MTDKQIIEYKHTKCTKEDCCHYCGSIYCGYVDDVENLEKAYKAKEQECEELAYENYELNELFDRLKAESEELKNKLTKSIFEDGKKQIALDITMYERDKLKQTLTEIKEIVEKGVKIHDDIIVSKQILQKISEVDINESK